MGGQVVDWQESTWSLALRVIHGVDDQMFLALTAVLLLLSSASWNRPAEGGAEGGSLLDARHGHGTAVSADSGRSSRHVSRDRMIPHIVGAFLVLGLIMVVGA